MIIPLWYSGNGHLHCRLLWWTLKDDPRLAQGFGNVDPPSLGVGFNIILGGGCPEIGYARAELLPSARLPVKDVPKLALGPVRVLHPHLLDVGPQVERIDYSENGQIQVQDLVKPGAGGWAAFLLSEARAASWVPRIGHLTELGGALWEEDNLIEFYGHLI